MRYVCVCVSESVCGWVCECVYDGENDDGGGADDEDSEGENGHGDDDR